MHLLAHLLLLAGLCALVWGAYQLLRPRKKGKGGNP